MYLFLSFILLGIDILLFIKVKAKKTGDLYRNDYWNDRNGYLFIDLWITLDCSRPVN